MATIHLTCIFLVTLAFGLVKSDIEKDKEECTSALVGLATCLPYAEGDAKAPTLDCCSGIKDVLKKNKKCLCLLVKDRNDPSLGLKINATLALGLPATCHAPANISECPSLLHLAPNSPDAKVFEDYVKNNEGNNTTAAPAKVFKQINSLLHPVRGAKNKRNSSTTTGSSAKLTSEGGRRKRWLVVEMISFIIASIMVHVFISN